MAKVKGAGDSDVRENPAVHSKAHRHGMPWHPAPVTRVSGVAPAPGGRHEPTEVAVPVGGHVVTHHHPSTLGSAMADGKKVASTLNHKHTDIIHHESGPDQDSYEK